MIIHSRKKPDQGKKIYEMAMAKPLDLPTVMRIQYMTSDSTTPEEWRELQHMAVTTLKRDVDAVIGWANDKLHAGAIVHTVTPNPTTGWHTHTLECQVRRCHTFIEKLVTEAQVGQCWPIPDRVSLIDVARALAEKGLSCRFAGSHAHIEAGPNASNAPGGLMQQAMRITARKMTDE